MYDVCVTFDSTGTEIKKQFTRETELGLYLERLPSLVGYKGAKRINVTVQYNPNDNTPWLFEMEGN